MVYEDDKASPPPPPLPTKAYTALVPIFAKNGAFFQWEAANSRNEEKGFIFQACVREILKEDKILQVIIFICVFRMFELSCINNSWALTIHWK